MLIHSFCVEIAKEYGYIAAILFNHIAFGVMSNRANNVNIYDGEAWVYNSVSAYTKIYPYLTYKQIRNALELLEEKGVIKSGIYNATKFDRTKWYTLTEKGYELSPACLPSDANAFAPQGKPIPLYNNNIYNNNTNNSISISNNTKSSKTDVDIINNYINQYTINTELRESISEFISYRKSIKKPMEEHAVKLLLKRLDNYGRTDAEKIEILNQSIVNGWQGIFPLNAKNRDQPDTPRENLKLRGKMI